MKILRRGPFDDPHWKHIVVCSDIMCKSELELNIEDIEYVPPFNGIYSDYDARIAYKCPVCNRKSIIEDKSAWPKFWSDKNE